MKRNTTLRSRKPLTRKSTLKSKKPMRKVSAKWRSHRHLWDRLCDILKERSGGWDEYELIFGRYVPGVEPHHVLKQKAHPRSKYNPAICIWVSRPTHVMLESFRRAGEEVIKHGRPDIWAAVEAARYEENER